MNRMTRWDPVCHCYKAVREQEQGRSVIQELGVYESIHEKEIEKAVNIGDIRDMYFTKGAKLDPYWENFGKPKTERSGWIPVKWHEITEDERVKEEYPSEWLVHLDCILPEDGEEILITTKHGYVGKDTAYCDDGYYLDSGCDWVDDVVAWMPLPEPYKAESEDKA